MASLPRIAPHGRASRAPWREQANERRGAARPSIGLPLARPRPASGDGESPQSPGVSLVTDPQLMAPLAAFHGPEAAAPPWFDAVDGSGARADLRRGRGREGRSPRLGRARQAGADVPARRRGPCRLVELYRAVLRDDRRVVAPTFTGMGRSDWREPTSSSNSCARRARRARPAAHLRRASRSWSAILSADAPRWVCRAISATTHGRGHGRSTLLRARRTFGRPRRRRPRGARVQHSLAGVIARFRLMPPQLCDIFTFSTPSPAARFARRSTTWACRLVALLRSAFLGEIRPDRPGPDRRRRALSAGADPWREFEALQGRRRRLSDEFLSARRAPHRHPGGRAPRDDRPAAGVRGGAAGAHGSVASNPSPVGRGAGVRGPGI